jgi:transposase
MSDGNEVYKKSPWPTSSCTLGVGRIADVISMMRCRYCPKPTGALSNWRPGSSLIGKLYRVEALAKEHGQDATALLQSRQTHSVAVLQEI